MSGRIDKIITRLEARIAEGQYYEAQQQARVVAARHIKAQNWEAAIDLLFRVSQALLKAGQGGSGGDLCLMMVDVFVQAKLKPDPNSRTKVLGCLRLFDSEEPTRKKYIGEILGWSAKFGEFPAGDPELHHVVGSLYADEHVAYEAERHLVLGTKESPEIFGRLEYTWYKESGSPHDAAVYASRAVLPYLLVANVRGAHTALRVFTTALSADNPALAVEHTEARGSNGGGFSVPIFPSLPLLNFLGLLLAVVQTGNAEMYKGLMAQYKNLVADAADMWDEALNGIAEMYFKIQRPRQHNPLMDMMGSLFGGAPPTGGAQKKMGIPLKDKIEAPVPEGLD
ncbi:Golgi to ER traffic protein 4 [Ceratocystis lukuohia]|uniref:Golgi to ER traffic protein 4 n=1 Tax=Ceratocystis lukuohia TaxID=2019550 RepID=A0ABR4MK04_9PEZI